MDEAVLLSVLLNTAVVHTQVCMYKHYISINFIIKTFRIGIRLDDGVANDLAQYSLRAGHLYEVRFHFKWLWWVTVDICR